MLNQPKWINLREASKLTPYDANYLGLLVRKKKIKAQKINGKWHTTEAEIERYLARIRQRINTRQAKFGTEPETVSATTASAGGGVLGKRVAAKAAKTTKAKKQRLKTAAGALLFLLLIISVYFLVKDLASKTDENQYEIRQGDNQELQVFLKDPEEVESVMVVPQ